MIINAPATGTRLAHRLSPKDNAFNLIRLVAALAVVVGHALVQVHGPQSVSLMGDWTPYDIGQHAVNVFFVLSGIMVFASIERSSSLMDFFLRRALRIYPALVVCLLAIMLVVGPLLTSVRLHDYFGAPQTWLFLPKMLLIPSGHALPGLFETLPFAGSVDEPLWTIKYEVMAYILLGAASALGLLSSGRLRAFTIAGFVAPFLVVSFIPQVGALVADTSLAHVARFLFCFGVGLCAYQVRHRLVLSGPLAAALLAVTSGLSLALSQQPAWLSPLWVLALGYGALVLGARPLGLPGAFARRMDLSFGVYIYGWTVAQILLLTLPSISAPWLAALSIPPTLALAFASWHLVEKPALALKSKAARPTASTLSPAS